MKNSLHAIVFGAALLVTSLGLAQQQEEPKNSSQPFNEQEFADLKQTVSQEQHHTCLTALLETKSAAQLSKVDVDWRKYISVMASQPEWLRLAATCGADEAYIEILLNSEQSKTGAPLYRLRDVFYTQTPGDYSKVAVFSPYMDKQTFSRWLAEAREVVPVKLNNVGTTVIKSYFQKITMTAQGGQEVVVASVENRLAERTQECSKLAKDEKEYFCEDTSYSVELNWMYNNFVSYSEIEGMEDARYQSGATKIVSLGKTQATSISDIRDIFSEQELLASLRQDWIIRNSDQWTRFSKAQTWSQFWNFTEENYYGPLSRFQSYSNKIKPAQVPLVMACADKAAKDTSTNAGYLCIKETKTAPTVYMYNYYVSQEALKVYFRFTKMDDKAVYVQIPLGADSTGTAVLQLALNKKQNDVLKVFRKDY